MIPDIVIAVLVLIGLSLMAFVPSFKIVRVNQAAVVERLGSYLKIIDKPGVYFLLPFIDRMIEIVYLDNQVSEFTISSNQKSIHFVLEYKIIEVKKFVYHTIDSLGSLKKQIASIYLEQKGLNQFVLDTIREEADELGVELISLNIK